MSEADMLRKVQIPHLTRPIVHRQALLTLLNDSASHRKSSEIQGGTAHYRAIIFSAPGGYGKTTALIDFVKQATIPCCWYELDHSDNDKVTFLENLLASIQRCFPAFTATFQQRLKEGNAQSADEGLDDLLIALEREIREPYAMILCNFHEINSNPVLLTMIDTLIAHLPEQCTVIIESRTTPALSLTPLMVRREVFTVGVNLLRFNTEEIQQLVQLQQGVKVTQEEANFLATTFQGWIAGILLGMRVGKNELPQFAIVEGRRNQPLLQDHRQAIFVRLLDEVFKREPEVYSFLKETAILQQLEPIFCDMLLHRDRSAQTLRYVEQQGLFVTRVNDGGKCVYVFYPILRDVLCESLREQDPAHFHALQVQAAKLFRERQEYQAAYYHAAQAQDYALCAALIIEIYQYELKKGHLDTIARWIDELPKDVQRSHARLLVIRANIYLAMGNATAAAPLVQQADLLVRAGDVRRIDEDIQQLRIEIALTQCKLFFFEGNYEQARELCQNTLAEIPDDAVVLRIEAHLRLGMCAQTQGDFAVCIHELQRALQLLGYDIDMYQTAKIHGHLANTYGLMGNLPLSEHHRARAIRCMEHLHDERGKALNLIGMGVTLQRHGVYEEAERVLNEALQIARGPIQACRSEAYALVSLGDVYQELGRYDEALVVLEDGLRLVYQLGDQYLIHYTHSTLGLTYLLMGDPYTAQLLVSNTVSAERSPVPISYDIALCELTRSAVLLQLCRYQEAYHCLQQVEEVMRRGGYKREQLQALLRLAGCCYALHDLPGMNKAAMEAISQAKQSGYEVLAHLEILRLEQFLSSSGESDLTQLHTRLLHLLEGGEDAQTHDEPAAQIEIEQSKPQMKEMVEVADNEGGEVQEHDSTAASVVKDGTLASVSLRKGPGSSITLLALGEPMIIVNGQPVTRWRVMRAMELCFYLLDRAKPVHKEQIMLELWPETESSVEQSLRSTVYHLRKTLDENCIIYRSGYYTLELERVYQQGVQCDVTQFEAYYDEGCQALQQEETQVAYEAFSRMVQLYRGNYLHSFYRDWCIPRRDVLRQEYIDARRRLATLTLQQEEYQECASHWQYILSIDNCDENAHYGLMYCYVKQGKRNLALRQYQRCVKVLREELNIEPMQSIQNLYQRIAKKR